MDAHVGKHLFEKALTGELGQNRTRILVTHHVSLTLPKTTYIVSLGDGRIEYAGSPERLKDTGALERVTSHDSSNAEQSTLTNVASLEDDNDLRKVMSVASHRSNRIDSGGFDTLSKNVPKKFVEDETKERGSIKLSIYAEYIRTSGGMLTCSIHLATRR